MEDQACPKCMTTLYRNPQMKLMVNVCGHNLCESCVDLLFAKGSGSCPECSIPLRRTNFRFQLFEDANIDKEIDIRKRILKDFNKKEEDFQTLREYNDYLEMVEDIIFNLSNNLDILETNKLIADYKAKNKDFITKHRSRMSKEELELEGLLLDESKIEEMRRKETTAELLAEKKLKEESKEKLIDDLMFSDANASEIVSRHKDEKESQMESIKQPKFSTGLDVRNVDQDAVRQLEAKPYRYESPSYTLEGPPLPSDRDLVKGEFMKAVREVEMKDRASGYHEQIPCVRALQDAMCGLFFGK